MPKTFNSKEVRYEVAFRYDCQLCGVTHEATGVITGNDPTDGPAVTGMVNDVFNLLKSKIAGYKRHGELELLPDRLSAIEVIGEGVRQAIDLERLGFKKPVKLPKDETPEEVEKPEAQVRTDIGSIKKMLEDRMVAIRKREKEIDVEVERLSKELEASNEELADLEKMLASAKELKPKAGGKKK